MVWLLGYEAGKFCVLGCQALERSHLSDHVARLDREVASSAGSLAGNSGSGLDTIVQEQGKNFSLGHLDNVVFKHLFF